MFVFWFHKAVPLIFGVEEYSGAAEFVLDLWVWFLELSKTQLPVTYSRIALVRGPPFFHPEVSQIRLGPSYCR